MTHIFRNILPIPDGPKFVYNTLNVLYCGFSCVEVRSTAGVPQGLNLGPLHIFVNIISNHLHAYLY